LSKTNKEIRENMPACYASLAQWPISVVPTSSPNRYGWRRVAMLALFVAIGGAAGPGRAADPSAVPDAACPALLQHTFNRLQTGQPQSLCQFQGKVLLGVNTASYCGYTH
jgi:hypothetical protein